MPYDKDGRYISAKHIFDDRQRELQETEERLEIESMKAAIVQLRSESLKIHLENVQMLEELQEARRAIAGAVQELKRLGPGKR